MKMKLMMAVTIAGSFLAGLLMAASTQTLTVDCGKGDSINDQLAKAAPDKNVIIQVSGTCTETVTIADFEGLSLQLAGNPTAILNNPSSAAPGAPVVNVVESRQVTISGLTINGATRVTNCRNCFFNNNVVNSPATGIAFFQSEGVMQGNKIYITPTTGLGPIGVGVSALSDVGMFGNEIHGLGSPRVGLGVSVNLGAQVRMSGGVTGAVIEGFTTGLVVRDGSGLLAGGPPQCGSPLTACILVSNNNQGARITSSNASLGGMTFDANAQGVYVELGSSVSIGPNSAVTNSTGSAVPFLQSLGVFATHNSSLVVGSLTSITGNGDRGVAVGTNSSALLAPPNLVISGNLKNVTCDATSIVTGANSYTGGPPPIADCPNQVIPSEPVP